MTTFMDTNSIIWIFASNDARKLRIETEKLRKMLNKSGIFTIYYTYF